MNSDLEKCPWCGSGITREKFKEIEEEIRSEQKKELENHKAAIRTELTKEFAGQKLEFEARLNQESVQKINRLDSELSESKEKFKSLEASTNQIIERAKKEAEDKAKENLNKEITSMRLVLEKDNVQKILKQQESFSAEKENLQKKLKDLEAQLQEKKTDEIAGSTRNLFVELQTEFSDDEIAYHRKNEANEIIICKVVYKDNVRGSIIIDFKNRQSWQKKFATNLRKDQVDLSASHALLVTTFFPKDKKEIFMEEGVIVSHPNCVIELVRLLRAAMIKIWQQGLTMKNKNIKVEQLYDYILSDSYKQKRQMATSINTKILELEVQEKKQHDKTWKERGELLIGMKNTLSEINSEIDEILEKTSINQTKPASREILPKRETI